MSGSLWSVLAAGYQSLPTDVRGTAAAPASLPQTIAAAGFI